MPPARRPAAEPSGAPLQYVSRLSAHADPDALAGHFVLGRPPPTTPPGWTCNRQGDWTVATHPSLPVRTLVDGGGAPLGWLLGHPLVPGATEPAAAALWLDLVSRDAAGLDARLHELAGNWVALVVELGTVVPDANATLPTLFDAERGVVSSSPFLLQAPDELPPDDELASVVRAYETGLWFLFDTTPHAGARRVLANHTLDLATWEQTRRWPAREPVTTEPEAALEATISGLERTMRAAVADSGELACSLTAGGDTREILAASRELLDRVRFFTVAFPDHVGRRDVRVAQRVARRFGLDHRVLPWRAPTPHDVATFMVRTGALVGERRGRLAGPTYAQLGGGLPYVTGVNGALGNVWRDLGWRESDVPETTLTAEELLARFFSPSHPRLVERAEAWLAPLSGYDFALTMSLATDELRVGCWGGALTTAYPDACSYILYPFSYRPIKEAMFAAPFPFRRSGTVREEVIRRRWPELLEVAINPGTMDYRVGSWRVRAGELARHATRTTLLRRP